MTKSIPQPFTEGSIIVVKFGGNAMVSPELKKAFAEDMVWLQRQGLRPVVVHGGGPQISARLKARGIASEFQGGYRVTTAEMIPVVRDVLLNEVNPEIVQLISESGVHAVGYSGESGGLFVGRERGELIDGVFVDLGLVGDVVSVDSSVLRESLAASHIPVVSSIAPDGDAPARTLNINADSAASALAVALGAERLIVLTDVAGLYSDWPNLDSLVTEIGVSKLAEMLPGLESGMIPKMRACVEAIEGGVMIAHVIDGRVLNSVREVFTGIVPGTSVIRDYD